VKLTTTLLTVAMVAIALAVVVVHTRQSLRAGRVVPGLWLCLAMLALSWVEAPYDWAVHASFHPDFPKFGHWGIPFMTHGGLPVGVVPAGYVAYFWPPTLLALALVRRVASSGRMGRLTALLTVGLGVGIMWDLLFELVATRVGFWRYSATVPGLVLFPHTDHMLPLFLPLAIGIQIMACVYFLGATNDRGENTVQQFVRERVRNVRWSAAGCLALSIVYVHVFYVLGTGPAIATKVAGWQTSEANNEVFAGHPNQSN
jgi:hypothetical protein